jgi:4,5-dihydroxyphthalate decarboxylase
VTSRRPNVHATLAVEDYDHVRDLVTGAVPVEGVDLTCLHLPVEEIFFRFVRFREWHVSELSLAKYASLRARGDDSLTAIPVFTSRMFRHSAIFVRDDGPVGEPARLAGARVGIPEWTQTATVYVRGLLTHTYGIPLDGVSWFQAGVNEAGRIEGVPIDLPTGVSCTPVTDRTLNEMLLSGDLDAVISAHPPTEFTSGSGRVVRLFPDYRAVEEAYYRTTGIFPIMHLVALRRDIHDAHPWVAMNLLRAFEEAKRRSLARAVDANVSHVPIPWGIDDAARARDLFGRDWWPYGVEPNRTTLDAFLGYAFEQGVCDRRLDAEELFAPEVRQSFLV